MENLTFPLCISETFLYIVCSPLYTGNSGKIDGYSENRIPCKTLFLFTVRGDFRYPTMEIPASILYWGIKSRLLGKVPWLLWWLGGAINGKQGKCITLAIFASQKCLLGCPQTLRKPLDKVSRGFPVCGPVAIAPGPYALTAPQPPKVSPAVQRGAPTNPHSPFAGS